ncbi:M23 family metallopeptidase [Sedimentibacter sp.]|uniref:M23 family metallopeptidase n=1 Tax=Sedimentibacter sp. TaxID=1960295 RepID=UPI0028A8E52F|nr:M23 family metallopeptidase [Sedimentibacter sp.]
MNKKVIILLLSLLLITGCSINEKVTEIEAINLSNGEKIVLPGDSEHAAVILKALNNNDKTDISVAKLTAFEINVKKDSKTNYYKLNFDVPNKSIYVTENGKNFKVNDGAAKQLFLNENFSYVYIDNTLYDSYIDYNGENYFPEIGYDWTYKNIDGHYTKKEGIIKSKSNEEIVYTGNESLDIKYEKQPDSQVIRVFSQGNPISTGKNLQEVLNNLTVDGEYDVECQTQWLLKDNSNSYGNQTVRFTVSIDKPADVTVITKDNYPGNILLVSVDNLNLDETVSIKTEPVKVPIDMYTYKGRGMFVCPVDLYAASGTYDLNAIINEGKVGEYTVAKSFEVKEKSFKTQYLTVSEEMNETNNDNTAIYEFAQLVKPARTNSAPEKLWEGTFIMPVEGRLTTDFAEIRFVNNEQSSSRHSGLDLAAPIGTEIKAPNNGIVTFAMEGLLSPGNTVVIDHGMGLFTSYYHLDSISVNKGDKVKKGDIIGTVGTTGFSTGPHLHYAVSIYNTYVNPYQTLSGIID